MLALGRMGDRSALGALAELQRTASTELQPSIAAAICLLGQNCGSHGLPPADAGFAEDHPGYQELVRAAAAGLGAIARAAAEAVTMLLDIGVPSEDPRGRRSRSRWAWWRSATPRCSSRCWPAATTAMPPSR